MTTWRELRDSLGPEACHVSDELAAAAPPLSPQTYAELAVLLRRDPVHTTSSSSDAA